MKVFFYDWLHFYSRTLTPKNKFRRQRDRLNLSLIIISIRPLENIKLKKVDKALTPSLSYPKFMNGVRVTQTSYRFLNTYQLT